MAEVTSGKFRKKRKSFAQVSNHCLQSPNISLKAKGLYALIQSYIDIPDFTLYKTYLQSKCSEGERAFHSAWSELKESGYLIQYKIKGNKGFYEYEYELLDLVETTNPPPQNVGVDNVDLDIADMDYVDIDKVGVENPPDGNSTSILYTDLQDLPNNSVINNTINQTLINDSEKIIDEMIDGCLITNYPIKSITYAINIKFDLNKLENLINDIYGNEKTLVIRNLRDSILNIFTGNVETYTIAGITYKSEIVRFKIGNLTPQQVKDIVFKLTESDIPISNLFGYITSMLFNSFEE